MERFAYARSKKLEHAREQSKAGARVKGGGTDLLAQMKRDLIAPQSLVSLDDIRGIRGVRVTGDGARIGAGHPAG